jgi:hypothetical protein
MFRGKEISARGMRIKVSMKLSAELKHENVSRGTKLINLQKKITRVYSITSC